MAQQHCSLSEKQIELLLQNVAKHIAAAKNSGNKFNPEEYMKKLYTDIASKRTPEEAMDYVSQVPRLIMTVHNLNEELADYLDENTSLDGVNKLRKQFKTAEGIASFVGIQKTGIEDALNQIIETTNPTSPVISSEVADEVEQKDKSLRTVVLRSYSAFPLSALSTFNQEAQNYDGVDAKQNIPDPDPLKKRYYKVVRKLNDLIGINGTADKVKMGETTGIFLRLVPASSIEVNDLYTEEQKYLSRDDSEGQFPNNKSIEQKQKERNESGVYLVYTDKEGNTLHFDENGNLTTKEAGGKMLYTKMRLPFTPTKDNAEKGHKAGVRTIAGVQSVEDIVKKRAVSPEEAQALREQMMAVRQAEIEILDKSREYIKNNPNAVLLFSVRSGNNGYVEENFSNPIKIGSIKIPGGFKPTFASVDNGLRQKGGVYFTVPGYPHPILIVRPKFSEVEGLTETLANVLFGKDMSNTEKINLVKQFLHSRDTNVYEKENGDLVFKQNETEFSVTPENRQTFIDNLNGQIVNINKDLLNNNYKKVTTENGKVVVSSENYNKFLSDNFSTYLQKNAEGNILTLNAYNKIDPTPATHETIFAKKEKVSVKPTIDTSREWRGDLESRPVYTAEGVNTMRSAATNAFTNFGNPFSEAGYAGTIKVASIADAVVAYKDWLLGNKHQDVKPQQREWILDQINQGKLDGAILLYAGKSERRGQGMHPTALAEVVEQLRGQQQGNIRQQSLEQKTPTDQSIEDFKKAISKLNFGLKKAMGISSEATDKQIEAARQWYTKSPLSKVVPFENLMNMVNSDAVAEFTLAGIRLFKGSNYTDLYHEAWHVFSQIYLTKDQKQALYQEARKLNGSFTTANGRTVKFKDAEDIEIEEFLAEDFRKYVLSDGKKIIENRSARNNIFSKIYNFLKSLFKGYSYKQSLSDQEAIGTIKELYDKLYIGKVNEYKPSLNNVQFDLLNKGIQALDAKASENKGLSYQDSAVIVETLDSLIADLLNKSEVGLGAIFVKPELMNLVYQQVRKQIEDIRNTIEAKEEKTQQDLNNLRILNFALDNWGSYNDVVAGLKNGVVAYHKLRSSYIEFDDKYSNLSVDEKDEFDDANPDEKQEGEELSKSEQELREEFGENAFERKGNERSVFEMASGEVVYLIKSLPAVDKGKPILNTLGVPKLVDFNRTWGIVINAVQGASTEMDMYNKLNKAAASYPEIKELVNRLGNPSEKTEPEDWPYVNMWLKFYRDFSVYKVPIKEVRVVNDGQGGYKVDFSEASPGFMQVKKDWTSQFESTKNKYVKRTNEGTFLDTEAVKKDFPKSEMTMDNQIKFLRAIGLNVTDNKAIRSYLANNSDIITYLHQDVMKIKQISTFLTDSRVSTGRVEQVLTTEAKYSGKYSNNSIQNVKGDKEYDLSLNNTITQVLKDLNDPSKDYSMVNDGHMAHLNFRNNPHAKYSIILNSLFEVPTDISQLSHIDSANKRRQHKVKGEIKNVELQIINLNGIKNVIQKITQVDLGGVKTNELDINSKFIMDIHTMLMQGTMELPRHASKSSSYGVSVSKVNSPHNTNATHLYISSGHFATDAGMNHAVDLMKGKIAAEMERIAMVKEGIAPNIPGFNERGAEFSIFDDILSDDLKKKLIAKASSTDSMSIVESQEFRDDIAKDIKNYFEKLTQENLEFFNEMRFLSTEVIRDVKKLATKDAGVKNLTDEQAIDLAIKSFTVNAFIHNTEMISLLYGDLAMYNYLKEEFHKRNASIGSTGRVFSTDQSKYDFVNKLNARNSYANKFRLEHTFDGVLNSVVFKDRKVDSVYFDEYVDALVASGKTREEAEKILDPYKKMNAGDAQGWITFDTYRALSILEGNWSDKQNDLFVKIVNEEPVDPAEVAEYFPPRKFQYAGPLKTDKLHIQAFHKFSLAPLVPSVIKGTNMETLHNNMVKQNVHYGLFESGSKLATITESGSPESMYEEDGSIKPWNEGDRMYTKNSVFLQYLKNQVDINSHWKDKTIFSTQLRKLIINDLFLNGIPNSEDFQNLVTNFEGLLNDYQEAKKKELLKEIGWTIGKDGQPTGNVESLVKFVRKELSRQELPDHTLEFIDLDSRSKLLKNDLSLSLNAEKIEKLLNAIIIKRLVRQKMNGEQLVQLSSIGFESATPFRKATDEEIKKYRGTNDLPTYRPGKGKDGKTSAMKIKIAMKGDFYKLLDLKHNDGKKIGSLDRLNEMLKNDEWLDKGNNRKMITMTAVRIPVQGLNSMEFMEVYEFLPEEAGNVLIPPAEIVAKSGSDFDIDKLTVFMPNISSDINRKLINKTSLKELSDKYPSLDFSKDNVNIILDAAENNFQDYDLTDNERKVYKALQSEFATPFYHSSGTKGMENKIIENIRAILEHPDNFEALIRPNDVDEVKGVADDLAKETIQGYDQYATKTNPGRVNKKGDKLISPTRALEPRYNLYKHESNNIGKKSLGIGAVDNGFSSIFKRIGAYLENSYTKYSIDEKGNIKMKNGKPVMQVRPINIRMDHNKMTINGKEHISLSGIDTVTKQKISNLISQLMNGWVDIEKDAWIFNINGNNVAGPVMLFMLEAGVDFKTAAHFVSQPLVVDYIKERMKADSPFYVAAGGIQTDKSLRAYKIRMKFFEEKGLGSLQYSKETGEPYLSGKNLYATIEKYNQGRTYTTEGLRKVISAKDKTSDDAKAGLLHFMELEDLCKQLTNIKLTMNVDTKPTKSLFAAQQKLQKIEELELVDAMSQDVKDKIKTDSPIASFFVQDFQLAILKPLMSLRGSENINNFIIQVLRGGKSKTMFKDDEKFVSAFHNDLPLYILQNHIKNIDINNIKEYGGLPINSTVPVQNVMLRNGAFVKDGVMYVDARQIRKDFESQAYAGQAYEDLGLHKLSPKMFSMSVNKEINFKEYSHFVLEREYLRSITPVADGQSRESYEEDIAKRALRKTFNFYYNLKSEDSIANEFLNLKAKYRSELIDNFKIFDELVTPSDREDKTFKSLKLRSGRLDKDLANTLHENLVNLSDFSNIKVADPVANREISNFFSRMILFEYLRNGITKGTDSIAPILPTENLMALMKEPMERLNSEGGFTEEMLNTYFDLFKKAWKSDRGLKNKFRNYVEPYSTEKISDAELERYMGDLKYVNENVSTFVAPNTTEKEGKAAVKSLLSANSDVLFIIPSNETRARENATLAYDSQSNVFKFPVRKTATETWTDETYEENVKFIDNTISELLSQSENGVEIAFPSQGIVGSPFIKNAPRTYTYLIQQLNSKLGFVHPGAEEDLGFRESVQRDQPISDVEVEDFMKQCFG